MGAVAVGVLLFVFGTTAFFTGSAKLIVEIILGVIFVGLLIYSIMCINWYTTFASMVGLDMGYEKAELIDTTKGLFMTKKEARILCLNGSALLVGKK